MGPDASDTPEWVLKSRAAQRRFGGMLGVDRTGTAAVKAAGACVNPDCKHRSDTVDGRFGATLTASHEAILQLRAAASSIAAAGYGGTRDEAVHQITHVADALRTFLHNLMRVDGHPIPAEWLTDEANPPGEDVTTIAEEAS